MPKKEQKTKPRLERNKRRVVLIDVASELFLKNGFSGTSLDAVIERAGGSKRSIYTEFGGKEGLFSAMVTEKSDTVLSELSCLSASQKDLRLLLSGFAATILDVMLSPTPLKLYRIIMAESTHFPKLSKIFFEKGAGRSSKKLVEILETAKERKEIRIDDCALAADHFIGMLRGSSMYMQVLLKLRKKPGKKELSAFIDSAVETFLNGIR